MSVKQIVIIYNEKYYVSKEMLFKIYEKHQLPSTIESLLIGTEILYEVKDTKLVKNYELYNLSAMLDSFVVPSSHTQKFNISLKSCVFLEKHVLHPFGQLKLANKYQLRHLLPLVRIFGKFYLVCNKCKDVNSNIAIMTEK